MEITVKCRCEVKRDFILSIASFYAKTLKIENSRHNLLIKTVHNLKKTDGMRGAIGVINDNEIGMMLDSRLNTETLISVIAHEMIHVKQRVRGQLKHYFKRNGDVEFIWCGKKYNVDYYDSPWEIEAFSRERILANKIAQLIKNS